MENLNNKGKLGFVLPQNLIQASGGGDGFRRFRIKDEDFVKVLKVDDFSLVNPFSDIGASNKTATIILYFTPAMIMKYVLAFSGCTGNL